MSYPSGKYGIALKHYRTPSSFPKKKTRMRKRTAEKTGGPVVLGDSMARLYASQKWQQHWRLFRLGPGLAGIVGEQVARLTSPAQFRHDVLWVYVQDSSWMHHFQFVKQDLLGRVNLALGAHPVADIRWMLQPAVPPPRSDRLRRCDPSPRKRSSPFRMTRALPTRNAGKPCTIFGGILLPAPGEPDNRTARALNWPCRGACFALSSQIGYAGGRHTTFRS
jgi:hypothetical protein